MSSNLTEIGNAISNLTLNYTVPDTNEILINAIRQNNLESNGWAGLVIYIIMCASIAIYLWKFKSDFNLFDPYNVTMATLSIFVDIGIYLIIWEIVESYAFFMWFFTLLFIIYSISLLRKDMLSTEA